VSEAVTDGTASGVLDWPVPSAGWPEPYQPAAASISRAGISSRRRAPITLSQLAFAMGACGGLLLEAIVALASLLGAPGQPRSPHPGLRCLVGRAALAGQRDAWQTRYGCVECAF
jgi:hypothetical protein